MLIRKLSSIAALCGFLTMSSSVSAEDLTVKEMLIKQQQQIEALQNKIAKQETVHNEALTHYIKNEVNRALKDHSGSILTLGSNIENLTIKGDLRVRYEDTNFDNGENRDRFRQRMRLGFKWLNKQGWEMGVGVVTGGPSATSANATYSNNAPFESADLRVDYAYAKHTLDNGMIVTIGQMKNPFVNAGIIWDTDIRPVGVALQDSYDSGFFYALGGFQVSENGKNSTDAQLGGAQVGYKDETITAAVSYFHFNHTTSDDPDLVGDPTGKDNVQAASAYLALNGKTDLFSYKIFGEITKNLGADGGNAQAGSSIPEDQDMGWVLGAEATYDRFRLQYTFAHQEGDAFVGALTDAALGNSITSSKNSNNVEGHVIALTYRVSKNFSINTKLILAEAIRDAGGNADDGQVYRFDCLYKF